MPLLNTLLGDEEVEDDVSAFEDPEQYISNGRYNRDDVYLLYHPVTRKTGQRLRDYIGCPGGEHLDESYDIVIRWGSRRSIRSPRDEVLNPRRKIRQNTDKLNAMGVIEDADVPVPPYTTNESDIGLPSSDSELSYPVLGRATSHSQGSDINLILQQRDLELTDNDFFVEYEATQMEYRVQVFDSEIIKVHEKRLRNEAARSGDYDPHIRNHQKNWVFVNERRDTPEEVREYAIQAVEALDLDFGAVDVIHTEDDRVLVLEVNTAPTLDEANLERYGQQIKESLGFSSVAGMSNVDWSEDDEDEVDE